MSTKQSLLLSALLTAFTMTAMAQYPTDEVAPVKSQKQTELNKGKITLGKEKLLTAEKLPLKISDIEVVSALWDTAHLGFISLGSRWVPATPDKAMTSYLSEFVENAFAHLYAPDGIKLLWVIEDLRIGEQPGGVTEKAFIRLKATAYGSTDGQHYKRLYAMDEAKLNRGIGLTKKHHQFIANVFTELLQKTPEKSGSLCAKSDILAHHLQTRQVPALTAQMKDGVYTDFEAFRNNSPAFTQFEIKKGEYEYEWWDIIATTPEGEKGRVKSCWAVVKEGNIFRYVDGKLIQLERFEYGYVLSRYLKDSRDRSRAAMIGGILGGAVGAMVASGSGHMVSADAFPALKVNPDATAIDMETGAFIF
ncbi:hypothetical protein SAMN04488128_1021192 [Chitinophaga eiseniae]|uniref:SnoaL-like domain-containing protein n=1 Tax=Chitinophaga eiseniae TaxID=634771 RepID=A0A1T4RIH6_9BACT|nr:hypothetical protein [Chitinophaga eiseniae]SKA15782.1 hypothetical protein SAMN04488128_1021192 [Chitinophaga eiseniae]